MAFSTSSSFYNLKKGLEQAPSVTLNVYGHFLPGYNKNAADKVQQIFGRSQELSTESQ